MPHAMRSLWPIITHGIPAMETPETLSPGALRWTIYQVDGTFQSRWGSFASRGLPLAVCAPEMAQAFDPGCASPPERYGNRVLTLIASPPASIAAFTVSSFHELESVRYICMPM